MSTRSEVVALLDIIRDSALKALDEYERRGGPVPPLQSTETHPLDHAENKLGLKKIIGTLEGACEQLCSTLASPTQTVLNRVQDYQWICMRVVVKHKIADELLNHDAGIHVNKLGERLKIHPKKLASVLRILATKHCFREVAPDVFANNRLSLTLATTHSVSSVVMFSTDRHEYIHSLPEYLTDPVIGHSMRSNEAPFQYFIQIKNQGMKNITFYEWIELANNRERRDIMGKAMIGINEALGGLSAVDVYDWSRVTTVCDVGSGIGHFSEALLSSRIHVHLTLFDLPRTIENTRLHWKNKYSDRVQFAPGNFLQDIPAKNCDIYYMRNVLHNWNDEQAVIIMKTICQAMGAQSRLLIHDPILRPLYNTSHSDVGLDKAPEPLLPNYGAGYIQLHNLNMTMLSLFNANERFLSEITMLANSAGLQLLQVYDMSDTCLLEFALL